MTYFESESPCYAVRIHAEVNWPEDVDGGLACEDFMKDILLPFVPFVGMKLADVNYVRDPHEFEEVVWCMDEQRFEVWCKAEVWYARGSDVKNEMQNRCWVVG